MEWCEPLLVQCYQRMIGGLTRSSRELIELTKVCASACASYASKSSPYLMKLHDARKVVQINSVPENSTCVVTRRSLKGSEGVQLMMGETHVCVHVDVHHEWYHYWRVRYFPEIICSKVLDWTMKQPWWYPGIEVPYSRLASSHWLNTMKYMLDESLDILHRTKL